MKEQDQEIIREFLVESHENLVRLDRELVELEKHPGDAALLASIFRTFHTIKGTCGFLAFGTLEKITHQAENILSQLRDGKRQLDPCVVSLILETVDAVRTILGAIEIAGNEGSDRFEELTERLRACAQGTTQAAPSAALKAEEETARASSVADSNIRVPVGLLDKLMDLVGELVLTRNQILQFNTQREDAALNTTSQRLNLITTELQEGVMKTRMQPIGMVWNKLPRVVRDMAVALGKQVRLEMYGAETELDRTIIEAIKDPLVHLVRNSCDHGIEPPDVRARAGKSPQGTLTLRAFHEGGQVNIEIGDDGAGIDVAAVRKKAAEKGLLRSPERVTDREVVKIIFQPGFSTAKKVTNVSGRGVGMDVVKSNIEKIGGVVDVLSKPGQGTTVKLKIPLTLAIIPALFVESGRELFAIPQVNLLELIRMDGDSLDKQIEYVLGTPVYRRRGNLLPVANLNQVLDLEPSRTGDPMSMVVVQAEDRQFGLLVDGINDTQEIVVKPLGQQLKGVSVFSGATIMGDGRVALILDVVGIGHQSGVLTENREHSQMAAEQKSQTAEEHQRLLLFSAGSFERLAVPLSLVARLEEFPRSTLERAGGHDVVQYRGGLLPLVNLPGVLEPGRAQPIEADPAQVIVFRDNESSIGLVVDRIEDIVEEIVTARQRSAVKGLLGSGVIGSKVADFLDLHYVMRTAAADWSSGAASPTGGKRVLIADRSSFSRGLIRGGLDMAGYTVTEAGSVEEAIHVMERQTVDVVVAAVNLPSASLRNAMDARPQWSAIPILALADSAEQVQGGAIEDCQSKFDREAMLASLTRLSMAIAPKSARAGVGV
jgi:two-component system chemotaxis sensor kinase CheA